MREQQPDLFGAVPEVAVIARSTDPETSHQAARAFGQLKAQRSVQTVVDMLRQRGPLTDFEIRALWALHWQGSYSYTLPCKPRHWARQAGLVKHEGYGTHQKRRVRRWGLGVDTEYFQAEAVAACPYCGGKVRKRTSLNDVLGNGEPGSHEPLNRKRDRNGDRVGQ